ncbi:hypothetical protein VagYM19_28520 [Vibrio alginolyticus]|jgi:hypothetical protein|nr:hypothetical protein Vag1382_28490 [Vibrio alginolyticus]BCB48323.1 hypothetical protein VagVIO5_28490 [Vibrio alginolyticus]BCB52925.1 hypothetical protein VagYM19_28520 [Vibrio alginolyticus]BCB57528.1 hypothetical protein VagYM4_28510 [Vibrio alginolyticus]
MKSTGSGNQPFGAGKLIEVDNFCRDYQRVDESLSIGRRFDVFLVTV